MYGNGWWGHMGGMWIFWIVLMVLIVWVVQRAPTSSQSPDQSSASAEDILKRRYAQGDIGNEEYEQRLKDLRN